MPDILREQPPIFQGGVGSRSRGVHATVSSFLMGVGLRQQQPRTAAPRPAAVGAIMAAFRSSRRCTPRCGSSRHAGAKRWVPGMGSAACGKTMVCTGSAPKRAGSRFAVWKPRTTSAGRWWRVWLSRVAAVPRLATPSLLQNAFIAAGGWRGSVVVFLLPGHAAVSAGCHRGAVP